VKGTLSLGTVLVVVAVIVVIVVAIVVVAVSIARAGAIAALNSSIYAATALFSQGE